MNVEKWIKENTTSLEGKLVAITGASGDLGKEVCKVLVRLGANLLLINRSESKTKALIKELLEINSDIRIDSVLVDFESFNSVKNSLELIKKYQIDVFIVNAGAYKIERRISDLGYDNVFQINFISQYYLVRKLIENNNLTNGKVVVVSSIAHRYSKVCLNDIDFINNKSCAKVYGNSKRFLMYSMYELFKNIDGVDLSIVHPGISYTNITSHYPKIIFALIKYPMKVIFSKPNKASLSIIKGIYDNCEYGEWIGPKYFDIWGYPYKRVLKSIDKKEVSDVFSVVEKIYLEIESKI